MEKKVIYNNGNSELSVKFDSEIVTIEQKADGVGHNSIFMYEDELEDIYKFVKEKGSSGIGMSEKLNGIKENWNNVDWGIDKNDIDWLIEQAERVERLERELQNEVRKKNEIAADWSKIFDERYKAQEALRFYADENNWNEIPIADNYVVSVLKNGDSGEVAREALGESE